MTRSAVLAAATLLIVSCNSAQNLPDTTDLGGTTTTTSGGSPPVTTSGGGVTCWSSPTEGSPGPISFEDAAEDLELIEPLVGMHAHVAAFGDVNGDEMTDLVVGTFGDREPEAYQERGADGPAPDQLLISRPDLTPDTGWSEELGRTSGAVFADFDLDGDDDLLLIRHAGRDGDFPVPTRLFENVDGALQPHSEPLPPDFRGRTPAVADFDGDGLPDVYVSEDNSGETGGLLLHNEGSLVFTDVTEGSGLEGVLALSAAAGDLNNDLVPDLAMSTAVFINHGDLEFEEITPDDYAAVPIGEEDDPAGVAIGDVNRDGFNDIVVGQHYRATVEFDSEVPVRLFLSSGGDLPVFEDVTESAGLTPLPTLAPHVDLADL
ncbi:MAG TPA: VCBS repeat-containing protein, partial [Acidimicrobiia bacterium]